MSARSGSVNDTKPLATAQLRRSGCRAASVAAIIAPVWKPYTAVRPIPRASMNSITASAKSSMPARATPSGVDAPKPGVSGAMQVK